MDKIEMTENEAIQPENYNKLTRDQRRILRERYIVQQGGKCMYCGNYLYQEPPVSVTSKEIDWDLFPPNFLKYPIHLQHDHSTGMTEGAVHAYCNAVLWQYHGK